MDNSVPLGEAKYMVIIDFLDCDVEGYMTYEDAVKCVEGKRLSKYYEGTFDHYILEVHKKITIKHS